MTMYDPKAFGDGRWTAETDLRQPRILRAGMHRTNLEGNCLECGVKKEKLAQSCPGKPKETTAKEA